MFATSPTQNTTTAVPAWVPDALVSHTQTSEYLAELLDLSVTAGNAAVFSTIRTLHGMSSDESWEYAEAMRHADNVSKTLCPYLTQKHLWLKLWVEARRLGAITSPPPDQSPFGGVDLSRRTSASWTAPGAALPHQPRLPDFESEPWATFHERIKRELPIIPLVEEANQRLLTYGNYDNRATVILVLQLLPQEVSDRLQKRLRTPALVHKVQDGSLDLAALTPLIIHSLPGDFRARVIGALASILRSPLEKLRAFHERLHWLQSMATHLGVGFSAAQLWTLVREAGMTDFEATHFSASSSATITSDEPETGEQSAARLGTLYTLWNTFASEGYFAENAAPGPPASPAPPRRRGTGAGPAGPPTAGAPPRRVTGQAHPPHPTTPPLAGARSLGTAAAQRRRPRPRDAGLPSAHLPPRRRRPTAPDRARMGRRRPTTGSPRPLVATRPASASSMDRRHPPRRTSRSGPDAAPPTSAAFASRSNSPPTAAPSNADRAHTTTGWAGRPTRNSPESKPRGTTRTAGGVAGASDRTGGAPRALEPLALFL